LLGDEKINKMPSIFTVANGTSTDQETSIEVAREIIDQMPEYEKFSMEIRKVTPC
jgi:hypothetical protein